MDTKITTIKQAQKLVKDFVTSNGWDDIPSIDKFDHLHEELIEMSKILRYKPKKDRIQATIDHHDEFVDGIGDFFFALCRLANQLDVDIEEAFNLVSKNVVLKYQNKKEEKP